MRKSVYRASNFGIPATCHPASHLPPDMKSVPSRWLILLACTCLLTGCALPKRTWANWRAAESQLAERPKTNLPKVRGKPQGLLFRPGYTNGMGANVGWRMNLEARNPDFPATHIATVYVDLTAPSQAVHLAWAGPQADQGPIGPWRSSAGRGKPCFDCDEVDDSNTNDSWCTPKGLFTVAGFDDRLEGVPSCCYVTWVVHEPRHIGLHSHRDLPYQHESHGCIRLPFDTAKLIHNNSIAGVTQVYIYGKWVRPMIVRD